MADRTPDLSAGLTEMGGDIVFRTEKLSIGAVGPNGVERSIVRGVDLEVRRGEILSLIGESGSGKTTIALSAMGYTKPGLHFSGGKALLLGMDVAAMTPEELRPIRGHNVTYLAQSAAATFNPSLSILFQVTEAAIVHGDRTPGEARERAIALFRALELPNPESIGLRYPHQVSGGQLQRLMAAMALCSEPDLIVLDEPTTALDVTTQIEVLKAIKTVIADRDLAAIYVTHDLSVVAQIADRVAVIYQGKVLEQGPVERIIAGGRCDYTKRLIDAVDRSAASSGRAPHAETNSAPPVVLEISGVRAGYGNPQDKAAATVLYEVDLTVRRGETVAVIGESGCGKSTLARVIAGLLAPSAGEVRLGGKALPPHYRQRTRAQLGRIQFVHQMADTALNPRQSIGTILGRSLTFYHGLRGAARRERVWELLAMVELPATFAHRRPAELSGGQKQRVNLARALAAEPEVILCDEVISALDSIVAANIITLLKRLREETGVAFVFITHDLSAAASFADETIVLYGGRVVESGPTERVLSPPYHPYTRLLVASVPELRVGWMEEMTATREAAAGIARSVVITEQGCPFYPRCPIAVETKCSTEAPPHRSSATEPAHTIACQHRFEELA